MLRDSASLEVMGATVCAVVVFGAALFMVNAAAVLVPEDEGAAWGQRASDILTILHGIPDDAHPSRLHRFVAEIARGDVDGFAAHVARLVPEGASFTLDLDNGVAERRLFGRGPGEDGGSASALLYLDYDYTVVALTASDLVGTAEGGGLTAFAVPVVNGRHDPTAPVRLGFDDAPEVELDLRDDGVFVLNAHPPETPEARGFPVPYDASSPEAHAASLAAAAEGSPAAYPIAAGGAVVGDATYRVHPLVAVRPLPPDALTVSATRLARPGDPVGFAWAVAPELAGAPVLDGDVIVHGPLAGARVAEASLATTEGEWTWTVPRDAPFGVHVVALRLVVETADGPRVARQVHVVDVVPERADAATAPVLRIALTVGG